MVIVWAHQIPLIFSGPSRGALICSRYHYLGATFPDVTHSARCVMLVYVREAWEPRGFILGAIDCSCTLKATNDFSINWAVGETNEVCSATRLCKISTAHKSYQKKESKTGPWANFSLYISFEVTYNFFLRVYMVYLLFCAFCLSVIVVVVLCCCSCFLFVLPFFLLWPNIWGLFMGILIHVLIIYSWIHRLSSLLVKHNISERKVVF